MKKISLKLFKIFVLIIVMASCSQKKQTIYVNPDDNSLSETIKKLNDLSAETDVEIVLILLC